MKFVIQRETLLKPLQAIIGVVEKRHTMAVLANILIVVKGQELRLTATDLEIEMISMVNLSQASEDGAITIPARKLLDICRSLPDSAQVEVSSDANNKVSIKSGRSRFSLVSLSAENFPSIEGNIGEIQVKLSQKAFTSLLKHTYFAMAQQDVRYFLNGMLLEVSEHNLRAVATDGHRLAMANESVKGYTGVTQVIVPRKAIIELMRLVEPTDEPIELTFGTSHIRAVLPQFTFTSKLLDGRYPDYNRVIPSPGANVLLAGKEVMKQALSRTAILSNEKYRGVRLQFEEKLLKLMANNPEQEEAQDELEVNYTGKELEIGFNVSYLLDVLNAIDGEAVKISLANANSSALIQDRDNDKNLYVVMPIRL
ncbi:MAG: polymerase subunit beta [Gammaproteobacteria bacterium]|jgi:DNA polymerase-3 subunit beta|nr:polymerase subunit beta [Gammaproteobacteria bacterium]